VGPHISGLTGSIDLALHLCLPFIVEQCLLAGENIPTAAQQWLGIKGGRTWLAVGDHSYLVKALLNNSFARLVLSESPGPSLRLRQ
jgi:hypothetical protein